MKRPAMKRLIPAAAIVALAVAGNAAFGQGVISERSIGSALALEAASAASAECLGKGYRVSAAVVDRAGQLKAHLRADGAGPHTLDTSRKKAFTAATLRTPTTALLELVQKNPGAQTLPLMEGVLILGGGLPIRAGSDVVGAIGVGGAPGGHLDDQCAQAGIDKIKDRLN